MLSPCTVISAGTLHPEPTVVVLGTGRGGTSMTAGVVQALGVYMGPPDVLQPYYEDPAFVDAAQYVTGSYCPQVGRNAIYELIAQRNDQYAVWGWKAWRQGADMAGMFLVDDELYCQLRRPRLVLVYRDMVAIAQRYAAMEWDFVDALREAQHQYIDLTALVLGRDVPRVVVSYERACSSPAVFVSQLAKFLCLSPSPEQIALALSRIHPGSYEPCSPS